MVLANITYVLYESFNESLCNKNHVVIINQWLVKWVEKSFILHLTELGIISKALSIAGILSICLLFHIYSTI